MILRDSLKKRTPGNSGRAAEKCPTETLMLASTSKSRSRYPACLVTDCGRIALLEGAILGVAAGIRQFTGVPGLVGVVDIFLLFLGLRKMVY